VERRDKEREREREKERERERRTRNIVATRFRSRRAFALLEWPLFALASRFYKVAWILARRHRAIDSLDDVRYAYAYIRTRTHAGPDYLELSGSVTSCERHRRPARAQREIFTDKKAVFQIPYRFIALIRAYRLTIHLACSHTPLPPSPEEIKCFSIDYTRRGDISSIRPVYRCVSRIIGITDNDYRDKR